MVGRGSRLRPFCPLLRRTRIGAIVPRPRNDGARLGIDRKAGVPAYRYLGELLLYRFSTSPLIADSRYADTPIRRHAPRLGRPPSFRGRGTMAPMRVRPSKGQQGRSREPRPTSASPYGRVIYGD